MPKDRTPDAAITSDVLAANLEKITEADIHRLQSSLEEVRVHVASAMATAPTNEWPFPHAIVSPILPEWLYDMVCRAWPSGDFFGKPQAWRHILDLGEGQGAFGQLPVPLQGFWTVLQAEVLQGILGRSVVARYSEYFDAAFADVVPSFTRGEWRRQQFEFDRAGLMVHAPGFELKPHVDSVRYCAIYLLYCPPDDAHSDEGTDLYDFNVGHLPRTLRTTYPELPLDVRPAVSLAYKRNSLATFLVTRRSVHGVTIKRLTGRRVINCAVKLPEPLLGRVAASL